MFHTPDVAKLDRFNDFNDEQPANMASMSVTCPVLNFDKSNDVNDEQPENMLVMLVTFDVSKLDDNFNDDNFEQL